MKYKNDNPPATSWFPFQANNPLHLPHFSATIFFGRKKKKTEQSINPQKMESGLKPMDAEQLRENAHKMVDFIADYYQTIENFPVLSQVQPGYLQELLPDSAPTHPEPLQHIFDDIQAKILPGVTHWQSPNFFGYYPSNSSIAGFLGEMMSAGLNVVGFSWITSPAATELEMIVLDWFGKMLKLPEEFLSAGKGGGVIQGSASEAVLVVLLAARDKILRRVGKNSLEKLVLYASDQTHSALQKACQIGGIHPENCRLLRTDCSTDYALSPNVLNEAISNDVTSGLIPFFLCATVGTTSSTAVDPLLELGKIAKSNEMWFHVDAAYAGSACICPEYRHYIDGVEEADSFNTNAHKWFLTNFDCSVLWIKDRNALIKVLSTNPEFLKNKASQANLVVDYKDWQIPLGRRFRSLKLWMVMRLYDCYSTAIFVSLFSSSAPSNDETCATKLNLGLLDAVNSTGKIFVSHTVLSGKYLLRLAVGAPLTEERHVNAAWKLLQDEASALLATLW
ncbi:tyrosine decarboxylase 1 isoform X1 [Prunus yedoensis var. nudiflora]|uniref:Tyrosine decarboxylase 1 isoform X1 n=1 Tax=Prunus yedoensis var. nudiflora TaxID=2094558 RepID=A0A314ZC01_PRUYE|nr:tyrosine decarboxylase 1 isoform X1 [Prunus yedoensis var. nudiflora]